MSRKELCAEVSCLLKRLKELQKETLSEVRRDITLDEKQLEELKCIFQTLGRILELLCQLGEGEERILKKLEVIRDLLLTLQITVNQILNIVINISDALNVFLANQCRIIDVVPFTITIPGCYRVTKNLGPQAGNAITITVDDVTIEGNNHELVTAGPNAVGVLSSGHKNITIRNLNVTSNSSNPSDNTTNRGFSFLNADNILLDHIHTTFSNRGVSFGNANNVTILNSVFDRHTNDGTRVSLGLALLGKITNILVKDSQFLDHNSIEDAGRGLHIQPVAGGVANTDNILIVDCQFTNSILSALNFVTFPQINNVTVRGCQFTVTQPGYQGWSVMGVSERGAFAVRGFHIENCTVVNTDSSNFYEPVLFVGLSGGSIRNSKIHANSIGNFIDRGIINVALIHLGYTISGIIDTEDIPDAQVENVTIADCELIGGTTSGGTHQNCGIYIEAFSKDIFIDRVKISQTGPGQPAPPLLDAKRPKMFNMMSTFDGEVPFERTKTERPKLPPMMAKAIQNANIKSEKLKIPPPIPDQRAAAILADGAFNVIIRDCDIADAGTGEVPGPSLPANGITFSPSLEFQSIPGFVDPPLTITTPPTMFSKVINTTVTTSTGAGINDDGIYNSLEGNSLTFNQNNGITLDGFVGFVSNNKLSNNFGAGIFNVGAGYAIADNSSSGSLTPYVGVPAVVTQGSPAIAGQNLRF